MGTRALILVLGVAATLCSWGEAKGDNLHFVSKGPPPGFEGLIKPQSALVDVYWGGKPVGEAMATFEPGKLRFQDPGAVVRLLPEVNQPQSVLGALSGSLATHPDRICSKSSTTDCGTLQPGVAGIIFNESRFRVDVFVNPAFLVAHEQAAERYLPVPDAGPSLIDNVGGSLAGASDESTDYNLQNRAVLGYENARLRAETGYSSELGFLTDAVVAEVDRSTLRYKGGLFWAPGNDFIGQRRIYGVGTGTQIDTRLDRDQAIGNQLIVFLRQRSQVEILRDGRLLSSGFYDAGNQILDTSALPEGSYTVTIRIRESGGTREETRFFVKNSTVPLLDQPFYFAYGGALASNDGALAEPLSTPFLEAGAGYRLSPPLALAATAIATNEILVTEAGGFYFSDFAQVHAAALVSTESDVGVLLNLSSAGFGNLSYGIDARHIWSQQKTRHADFESQSLSFTPISLTTANLINGDTTQVSGSVNYQLGTAQLGLIGIYQKVDGEDSFYSIGPTLYWPFWNHRELTFALVGQATSSEDATQGSLGLRIQFSRPNYSAYTQSGVETLQSDNDSQDSRTRAVSTVFANVTRRDIASSDLTLGAGVSRTIDSTGGLATSELRGAYGDYHGAVEQDFENSDSGTQYTANFVTGGAVNARALALGGDNTTESGLIIRLDGNAREGLFDVLIDDQPRGRLSVGQHLAIFLTPYRRYSVRLLPVNAPLVSFDNSVRQVSLYPGNAETLAWSIDPIIAVFGRALLPDGKPLANARIEGAHEIGVTDAEGYFQVEVAPGATLTLSGGGINCRLDLGALSAKDGYAPVGDRTCR